MSGHIGHFALKAGRQPVAQMGFVLGQIDTADTDLLKPQFAAPLLDIGGQFRQIADRLRLSLLGLMCTSLIVLRINQC